MIAAIAVGAGSGYIYVRAEYPLAVDRLQKAIDQARDVGLLGENILGTEFSFDIRINRGAGAFVCGEGSALTASIEGNRGMPRTKPPRTVERVSGQSPPCSTMWRPLPTSPISSTRAPTLTAPSATRPPRHQGLCACGKHPPHRSHRGTDGNDAARDHFRYRRRHQGRKEIQGRADRRAERRLSHGGASRSPAGLRFAQARRRDHGLRRSRRHG